MPRIINPRRKPAAESREVSDLTAEHAQLRPQHLTQELLDWLISALEAVLSTPESHFGPRWLHQALTRCLKAADYLYPYLSKESDEAVPSLVSSIEAPGEA